MRSSRRFATLLETILMVYLPLGCETGVLGAPSALALPFSSVVAFAPNTETIDAMLETLHPPIKSQASRCNTRLQEPENCKVWQVLAFGGLV